MHASTQMAIHNMDGVRRLSELGFTRAVLARELSLREIATITAESPMETEVFIHGALCMCTSGCCTLSSMLGGRSGNRGLCAQPCRLNFRTPAGREYALSLKDLCGIPHFDALRRAGVASLKIEGRMKRPEYVAAAVSACVAARDGGVPDLDTLQAVFSRSGFTDGYLTGRRTLAMFGNRTKDDVVSANAVLKRLQSSYRAERASVPVSMTLTLENGNASLTVTDGTHTVTCGQADAPMEPCTREETLLRARRSLEKTGGTPFTTTGVQVTGENASLPVSALNALRRDALEGLLRVRSTVEPHATCRETEIKIPARHVASGPAGLRLRFARAGQIVCAEEAEKIILPLAEVTPELIKTHGEKLVAELPRLCWPVDADALHGELQTLRDAGLAGILAENLYGFTIAREYGFTVHGGFGLNVMNTAALQAYGGLGAADMTVSFELPAGDMASLGGTLPRGAVTYGYLPLMYFRVCPMQGEHGCAGCNGTGSLTDRKGVSFPVLCERKRYSVLHNSVPLDARGQLKGIDFETLYFSTETREQCERVILERHNGVDQATAHTRGLYFRELL